MSLSNLLTNNNNYNINCNSANCGSLNIANILSFDNNSGSNGNIVANNNGLPEWRQIELPDIPVGSDNTFLYSNNNTISWNPLNCQICSFTPYGKVTGGPDDPDPQDLGDNVIEIKIVKFQDTLQSNTGIITHPNETDFIIQKTGMYKITLCATIYSNNNSIGFGFCLNEIQDYQYGYCATSPIDTQIFPESPGSFRRGAGQCITMVRFIYLTLGNTFQVLANKQYQTSLLGNDNYFVGQKSSSLSFEYLGENYTS